jgi:hypothetical protein
MKIEKTVLTIKTKLLIFEYKEHFPTLSANLISNMFQLDPIAVTNLFEEGEVIVPSKMNK